MTNKPYNYKYEIGQSVRIECSPLASTPETFRDEVKKIGKIWLKKSGHDINGTYLIINRIANQLGVVEDRIRGMYIVSYQALDANFKFFAVAAEAELKITGISADAVVRWLAH
jgi:hypothetical protein